MRHDGPEPVKTTSRLEIHGVIQNFLLTWTSSSSTKTIAVKRGGDADV